MPSLEEAIDEKYGSTSFDCTTSSITIYVPKQNPRKIIPSLLVLNDCNIDTAGSEELKRKCQDVLELDLAQNKLQQWCHVVEILRHMPRLNFVNLSFNDLSQELPPLGHVNQDTHTATTFPHLSNLVLNSTHITWSSVQALLKALPSLEELHLSFNDFHEVNLCDDVSMEQEQYKAVVHPHVRKLHFTGNPINTWQEVSKLGQSFPNLESLVLAECPIKSLDPLRKEVDEVVEKKSQMEHDSYHRSESECEANERSSSSHHHLRYLKFLNLNYTLLDSWDDVDRLARFPQLQCLRIQGCPLFEALQFTEHERRQLLIARLGNVLTLNGGGAISGEEREDAERAFIRYYMEKPESDRPERYSELLSKHGKLDPLVNIDLSPKKKVIVTVWCKEVAEQRPLDVYQTVTELKAKLDGFCGIPARKMRLFYLDQIMKGVQGPEEMRFPNKQLYSYNIANGDEIIVDAKLGTFRSMP